MNYELLSYFKIYFRKLPNLLWITTFYARVKKKKICIREFNCGEL